jgi:hypothetical protein
MQVEVSGRVVSVDEEDAHLLSERKWYVDGKGYVVRGVKKRGVVRVFLFHREILGAEAGMSVDHIDGDPSNNQKANLRVCTHAENMRNRKKHRNNKSGFKGVCRSRDRWRAQINVNGTRIALGTFANIEDAAAAYVQAAPRYHGEFARTA